MKKTVLIIFLALSCLQLYAQIEKGAAIVSINGNYLKTNIENGVTGNQNVSQIKNLNIGTSVEYFITERFSIGIGLDYIWKKETRTNAMMLNRFYQSEVLDLKSKALLPGINMGYYFPIFDNIYIGGNLNCRYGKAKYNHSTLIAGSSFQSSEGSLTESDQYSSPYVTGSSESSKFDLFNAQILPELIWFFTPKLGLSLALGGAEYSVIDWKNDNSTWALNFNPSNWYFGVKVKI